MENRRIAARSRMCQWQKVDREENNDDNPAYIAARISSPFLPLLAPAGKLSRESRETSGGIVPRLKRPFIAYYAIVDFACWRREQAR